MLQLFFLIYWFFRLFFQTCGRFTQESVICGWIMKTSEFYAI